MNGKRKGLDLNKFKGCEYDLTREVLKLLSFFLVYLFTIIIIEWKNMYHLILKKGKQNNKKNPNCQNLIGSPMTFQKENGLQTSNRFKV